MSFDFDNSKNKNHLLQSLIQELDENSRTDYQCPMRTSILKSYIYSGLIFNFDLGTQLSLTRMFEHIEGYNYLLNGGPRNTTHFNNIRSSIKELKKDLEEIARIR